MYKKLERDGLKSLKKIEGELEEIKELQSSYHRSFMTGVLYGAGAIMGGITAVSALGWFLSVLGIIPGFGEIVNYLQGLIDHFNATRH